MTASGTTGNREYLLSRLRDLTRDRIQTERRIVKVMEELDYLSGDWNSTQAGSGVSVPNPEPIAEKSTEASRKTNAEAGGGEAKNVPVTHASLPISVLKLAKGWEEKLSAAGVATVGDLGEYISDGCLKPGCLPRVGPEAVEKIRAAYQGFTGEVLPPPSTGQSTPTHASEPEPSYIPAAFDSAYAEGKRFAEEGHKAISNPHPKGNALWASWDRGWQETFAVMEADDEATKEGDTPAVETPSEPASIPGPKIPDLDLSSSPAPSAPVTDDEFGDL